MIGIYTPSHKPQWLSVPYRSLREQEFDHWLVLLNGDCSIEDVPREVRQDARVKIQSSEFRGVGALKKDACGRLLCEGVQLLVELDHDDELTPNALEILRETDEREFAYSDTASKQQYGKDKGWTSRSEVVNDQRLWVHDTPEVCARSLYEIFYAPNHVRAWGRKAYLRSFGYDGSFEVCDDHDLLCRTYLAGVEMSRIPLPLYVQMEHEDQTQLVRNAEIQKKQAEVGGQHLYDLVREETRRRGLLAIDLGGRPGDAEEDFQALNKNLPADIVGDVRQGLPFEDDSVGVFRAADFLEHIPIGQVVPLMNEIYRCLAPGGWLLSSTPSTDGRGAFQDPTHVSFWNSNSFWYYTRKQQAQYVPEIKCRFQLTKIENHYPTDWHKLHRILYVDAALWALKGQRQIGVIEI